MLRKNKFSELTILKRKNMSERIDDAITSTEWFTDTFLKKAYCSGFLNFSSASRYFRYKDIEIQIKPGVLHPGKCYCTQIMLAFLETRSLLTQNILELEAGTGIISILAARKGANVTAADSNKSALINMQHNAHYNYTTLSIVESAFFDQIPSQQFDIILLRLSQQNALNCQSAQHTPHWQKRLFPKIASYLHQDTHIYISLSENDDMEALRKTVQANSLKMKACYQKKFWGTRYYILELNPL